MSWIEEFDAELAARGVRRSARARLVDELTDHLACESGGEVRLGVAREIAVQYADEFAADGARRGAFAAFAALAMTAAGLVVSQAALGRVGYPGYDDGVSVLLSLPALAVLVFAAQIAFVSGTLAAWRALRRRGAAVLPADEVSLLRRRTRIALAAGLAVNVAQGAFVADFADRLPAWWLALSAALALLATGGLAVAWRAGALGAATVEVAGPAGDLAATVEVAGPAGDLYDDLPPLRRLRGHPLALWASCALFCGTIVTVAGAHAERSLVEGLERGGFAVAGFTLAFLLLSRAVGARR